MAIEIKTELDSGPPVAGHESELREVLTNLVFNAVDAMPGVARSRYGRRRTASTFGWKLPIPAGYDRRRCAALSRNRFFHQGRKRVRPRVGDTVYGIIKRLRGTIDIASAVGMGTTFSIAGCRFNLNRMRATKQDGHSLDGVHLQILVVDDDPLVGRVTGEYLRVAGHQVRWSQRG